MLKWMLTENNASLQDIGISAASLSQRSVLHDICPDSTQLLTCQESSRTRGAPGGSPDGTPHTPAVRLPGCLSGLSCLTHTASAPRLFRDKKEVPPTDDQSNMSEHMCLQMMICTCVCT